MKTTAIIVAAGSGSRFNSEIPKQFFELHGKPVIEYALDKFEAAPSIDSIVLVLPSGREVQIDRERYSKITAIVAGGETRAASVVNGLASVPDGAEMVAVHDGARPLVTVDEIERTIDAARRTGAACLVAPVTDTIKSVLGDEIAATVDRTVLRRAFTPQAFRLEVLKKAFENANVDESITDECFLVERLGYPIRIVEGSVRNIKITHKEDLILAEALTRAEIDQ